MLKADTLGFGPEQYNHGQGDNVDTHEDIVGVVAHVVKHHRPGLINPESGNLLADLGDVNALVAQVVREDFGSIDPGTLTETAGVGLVIPLVASSDKETGELSSEGGTYHLDDINANDLHNSRTAIEIGPSRKGICEGGDNHIADDLFMAHESVLLYRTEGNGCDTYNSGAPSD